MFSSLGSADSVVRRLPSASGLGLSKTPAAEIQQGLHEARTVPASQVAASVDKVHGMEWCVGKGSMEREMSSRAGAKAGAR